jgi:arabinogalactan oligomer/maltooligosaccharide transport system permease protein
MVPNKRIKNRNGKSEAASVPFLAPALISILVFTVVPIIFTIVISFTNYNMYHMDQPAFVGGTNYADLVTGNLKPIFLPVFLWTVVFAVISTAGAYIIGLILAILLNNPNMKETRIYRAILIIPWALPATIATLSWQGLLNQSYGGINMLLKSMGLPGNIPWLTDPACARAGILICSLWLGYPYMMNVCLGALQALSPTYFEAAEIDGASRWQMFRTITLPLITRSSIPLVISSFAFNFNNFGNIYMITAGGPPRPDTQYAGYTDILASAGYKMTTVSNRYDLAAALSVLIFLVIGILTLLNMKASHSFEEVD